MRLLFTLCLAFAAAVAAAAQEAHLVVSARDLGMAPVPNRTVTLTPIAPVPRTLGTNLFSREPRSRRTDLDGVCVFSNVVWGAYRLDLSGAPGTSFPLILGTNTTGYVSAAALLTLPAALPPDPATNYYTAAQVDALLDALPGAQGAATNIYSTAFGEGLAAQTNGLLYEVSVNTNTIATRAFSQTLTNGFIVALDATNAARAWLAWTNLPEERGFEFYSETDPLIGIRHVGSEMGWSLGEAGDFSAQSFIGDGSRLTRLNATNITSGTLSPARMATNAPAAGKILYATSAGTAEWRQEAVGVVTLTDAETITTPCDQGSYFRVTLGGNRTLANPSNASDGQRLVYQVIQDGTGGRTLNFGNKFKFGADLPSITLSSGAGKVDFIGVICDTANDAYYIVSFNGGF